MNMLRVQWPDKINSGEVVKVRMLIQHAMDTGYLQDFSGKLVPRNVLHRAFRPILTLNFLCAPPKQPSSKLNGSTTKVRRASTFKFSKWLDYLLGLDAGRFYHAAIFGKVATQFGAKALGSARRS